jgi:hypothetical protein
METAKRVDWAVFFILILLGLVSLDHCTLNWIMLIVGGGAILVVLFKPSLKGSHEAAVASRLVAVLGSIYLAALLLGDLETPVVAIFSLLGLLIGFLVTLGFGVGRWRRSYSRWMLPFLLCLGFILLSPVAARLKPWIGDLYLKMNLRTYDLVVQEIRDEIPPDGQAHWIDVKSLKNAPWGVLNIRAERCADNEATVIFMLPAAGRMYNRGFVYQGCAEGASLMPIHQQLNQCSLRPMVGNWYHLSR